MYPYLTHYLAASLPLAVSPSRATLHISLYLSLFLTIVEIVDNLRKIISALEYIDFAGGCPLPVGVILRHHPERRPQPLQHRARQTSNRAPALGAFSHLRDGR